MLLLANPNSAVSRDQICQELHGRKAFANERAIDVHLSRLRQHLGDDAKQPTIIKTVRGAGYVFIAPIEFINTDCLKQNKIHNDSILSKVIWFFNIPRLNVNYCGVSCC